MANKEDMLSKIGATTDESEFYTPMPPGYKPGKTKFVFVMGTVISGLGKGIFSSSLAKLLQDKGLKVAPIKMEGYYNIDSGTLNPYRHGEVFVLDDGMETDMDLGTYERLLDQDLSAANFTTNGQIFREVLRKERDGEYLGRDVQTIPHVTGEIKMKLRQLAARSDADVVFDWEHNRVTGVYEGAKVDMPMPPGIQDDLSVQIALMVELLRDHTPEKFSLLSGNSVREYRYSRDGEETLKTPVEKFTIAITPTENRRGTLSLEWGTFRWTAPIAVP